MGLTAHLHCLKSDNVEDRSVCGEEKVEGGSQVGFLDFRGWEIRYVETEESVRLEKVQGSAGQ